MTLKTLANAPLGKKSEYITKHQPGLLYPIERKLKREELNINPDKLPFKGADFWNAYELSWLNNKGKPQVALGEFIIPCTSPNIIESKSFKLYLNSLNQTMFQSVNDCLNTLKIDLTTVLKSEPIVNIILPQQFSQQAFYDYKGTCLDELDINCDTYHPNPNYLTIDKSTNSIVSETLYTHLLKSNCLITNQPDWGSLSISYTGPKIEPAGLLRYIVSLREHNEFNEQCIERIFCNILERCQPKSLTVYGRYTRRGGLDTNPYRATEAGLPTNMRSFRQ